LKLFRLRVVPTTV